LGQVKLNSDLNMQFGKRVFITFAASSSSLLLAGKAALAQTDSANAGSQPAITQLGNAFIERTGIPGLSVAFAKRGQIIHRESFGFANLERKEQLNPAHSFRIASVSKPITAAAIFALIENGRLKLTNNVFGPQGVLNHVAAVSEATKRLTIEHLLTHSSGGWGNSANDPMFMHPAATHAELIDWTLKNLPLSRMPGTSYEYSNFGYCLLGRVIEKVSGKPYAQAAQELILQRGGISNMQIARNNVSQRAPNEVAYYTEQGADAYSMNITRMDSHGGWVATPTEMVKFAISVDGFRPGANVLQSASIAAMTRPSINNASYASGWAVNNAPNWWHTGSLPGTSSLLVRTASGMCWAACANARSNSGGKDSVGLLDEMMWKMARSVAAWQA
jgi:CubicO group peptidase (beta-lactamase class C family)